MPSFADAVRKFSEKVQVREDLIVRYVSFEAFRRIQQKTPVDTGRARASWRIGINRVDPSSEPERVGKTKGPRAEITGTAVIQLGKIKWGDSVYISNNLPYIKALEDGSSSQARQGMVSITLEELKAGLGRMVAEVKRNHP